MIMPHFKTVYAVLYMQQLIYTQSILNSKDAITLPSFSSYVFLEDHFSTSEFCSRKPAKFRVALQYSVQTKPFFNLLHL